MGFDFEHSIELACSADKAFGFVADFENNPRWQGGMRSCRWTSEQALGVGSTYVQKARFMGRDIDTHFRVTQYEPGRQIAIESTQSTFPIQVTRTVQSLGADRCQVTAHVRGQPSGIVNLMSGLVRRSIRRDYGVLKRLLEAQ